MVMAFKHQVLMSRNPRHLVMITLNHLDAIRDFVANEPVVTANIQLAYDLLIQAYGKLTVAQFQSIRYAILNHFLDYKVRVSIFLNNNAQNADGSFKYNPVCRLEQGVQNPGIIRMVSINDKLLVNKH